MRMSAGWMLAAGALALAGCHHDADKAGAGAANTAVTNAAAQLAPAVPVGSATSTPTPNPTPPTLADAATFAPLGSNAVKDAIHRALRTGQTQRWQDGELSGYAVPSTTADAHGCRTVRYTVDQLRDAAPRSINACEG
ncbi:hypothetical protein [Sphingomonas abietis]|uniref:Surface antigen domain-containing protein n=1 Tax=Sphingomonas abietis TaxID=3012344 RepID=A0ABY7NRW9_9SPHN|nr:hypothetical protein [Sphingomonas abietis]WBO23317.1 hypothetical protein PBT88_04050 [Sphingomonas abietis]